MQALVSLEMVPMIISPLFIISRGWTFPALWKVHLRTLSRNEQLNEWMKAFRDMEISR